MKFFKNVILGVVILAICIPLGLAIHYHHQWKLVSESGTTIIGTNGEVEHVSLETDPTVYQAMLPDFYAPQSFDATQRESGAVYLTFDCVPSANTQSLLDALAQQGVQATFFISGTDAPDASGYLKAIAEAGHTIGMTSWSNDYSSLYTSVESYLTDMYELFTFIKDSTGITPTAFRFPGGSINSYNAGIYRELIAEMVRRGFVPYDWNIDSSGKSGDTLVDYVTGRVASLDRAVIVLPDKGSNTISAETLLSLIPALQDRNFDCKPLQPYTLPVLFAYPE